MSASETTSSETANSKTTVSETTNLETTTTSSELKTSMPETSTTDKNTASEFDEYIWMVNEDNVNLECEAQILEEAIQELELEEMMSEEEDNITGKELAKHSSNSPPVVNGVNQKQARSSGFPGENEFDEYVWMENEDNVNLECEAEILEEAIQELELEEMLSEEEDNITGQEDAKRLSNSSLVRNGVEKQDQHAESEKADQ